MCKISLIVPVYNTGAYLKKCLESVYLQNFEDFEILIIDDGSNNEDRELCNILAKNDKRIRVFHQENHGLAYSRNFGIKNAVGEYLMFLDSDDYIKEKAFDVLYENAVKTNSDIVISGLIFKSGKKAERINSVKNAVLSSEALSEYLPYLKQKNLIDSCAGKLYKKSFVLNSGVFMPVGEIFEDTAFNLELLKHSPRISCIEKSFYCYVQRKGSITKRFNVEKLKILKKRYFLLNEVSPENTGYWKYFYIQSVFSYFADLFLPESGFDFKDIKKYISSESETDLFLLCVEEALADSLVQKIVLFTAEKKNVFLKFWVSRLLYLLKYRFNDLFLKIR